MKSKENILWIKLIDFNITKIMLNEIQKKQ